ncbi:MAG: VOC family protein [Pseudomonadota bacterium]
MELKSLGYVGVAAPSLDEWTSLSSRLLGMHSQRDSRGRLQLRLDDYQQRLAVDTALPPGEHYYGWETDSADSFAAFAVRLDQARVAFKLEPSELAQQRGVKSLLSFRDPAGNRLEVFHGPIKAVTPFKPSRALSGFRTGGLGLGHAVLNVAQAEPMLRFYVDVLGFGMSDYMLKPFKAYFLHLNSRHHSLALIETGNNGLHHIMVELLSLDDVGQAYDIALMEEERIGVTLGRHSNDFMTSFYARTPSNFMIEYGWGGRDINPATWQAQEFFHGASLWGHERYWLPPDKRKHALEMRLQAAADGFRAPVHVFDGNYKVMTSA